MGSSNKFPGFTMPDNNGYYGESISNAKTGFRKVAERLDKQDALIKSLLERVRKLEDGAEHERSLKYGFKFTNKRDGDDRD